MGAKSASSARSAARAVRGPGAESHRTDGRTRTRSPSPGPPHLPHPAHPATQFDRLIHDRTRLALLSALAASAALSFNDLKRITGTTDGNLSVHARRLEEAGYVECDKTFAGRTPRTTYQLTPPGRRALEKYLDHMEALIKATRRK